MPVITERHCSPLGRWLMAHWTPAAASPLRDVVDGLWYFEGTLNHLRERHFPTGRAELIVHLGPCYRRVDAKGVTRETFPRACVAGLTLGPDVVEAPSGESAVLGLRLHPVGAWAVLGIPMESMTGITVDLEDLAGGEARSLIDRCTAARTPELRLQTAACWIEARMRRGPEPDAAVGWMVRRIEAAAGSAPIGALTERTGWSATRMTDAFRREVGVTPKHFARIVRFRGALDLMVRDDATLSRVALDAGYYDQSHFTQEFRALTGFAPTAFLDALRFPGSPSLVEG
jgi:AraC-like DNA-binding protein